MGVLCRTSVLPSQLIASTEGKATSAMFAASSQRPIYPHQCKHTCWKTCQSSGLLAPSDFCFLATGKRLGSKLPLKCCIKALDASKSKLDCCDTNWLMVVPFPELRNYRFEKTWLCEGQLECLSWFSQLLNGFEVCNYLFVLWGVQLCVGLLLFPAPGAPWAGQEGSIPTKSWDLWGL